MAKLIKTVGKTAGGVAAHGLKGAGEGVGAVFKGIGAAYRGKR